MGPHLRDQSIPAWGDLLSDVLQHHIAGNGIEDDLTTRGQKRKPVFDLTGEFFAPQSGQGPEALIAAEFLALVADEVQGRQDRLAGG